MAIDWKKEVSFDFLKKRGGGSSDYPTKRTMNLYVSERAESDRKRVLIVGIILLVVVVLFVHFAVMGPLMRVAEKERELSDARAGLAPIAQQVKDYDSRRKERKLQELKDYFDQEARRYQVEEYLDWNLIRNPKWANASFSVEDAENEISGIITRTAGDVDYITGMESAFTAAMLIEYRRSRDLRAALSVEAHLKAVQEAEERKKSERLAETFREPENDSDGDVENMGAVIGVDLAQMPDQAYIPQQFIRPIEEDEPPKPKLYDLAFKVKVTMQQAHALKAFFAEQGIEYHKI
jgi:hypothetical protein